MQEKIISIIKTIEKEKRIRILFSIESGSRVWRLSSKDSDYDVRFVFVRPLEEYIRIDPSDDVIMAHFDKGGNKMGQEGCYIDISGFDVFKYSRMLSSSNPTVIEWLQSDIIYYGEKPKAWIEYATKQFKPISLYFHYKSMCKQNYVKYLKSSNEVTYKKYLYAMRGLVNSKHVANTKTLPFIDFTKELDYISKLNAKAKNEKRQIVKNNIIILLQDMIKLKKEGKEKDIIRNISKIDNYIEDFLKDDSEAPREKQLATTKELNEELRRIVLKK